MHTHELGSTQEDSKRFHLAINYIIQIKRKRLIVSSLLLTCPLQRSTRSI